MEYVLDWGQPISEEELIAIEAVLDSTSLLIKRRRQSTDYDKEVRSNGRRLPTWATKRCSTVNHNRQSAISNSQDNQKMRCPTMKFEGRVVYSKTALEVKNATMEIFEFIEAKKKSVSQVILGMDIEWKPTFRKGLSPGKAAVMQICGDAGHCYVMHIIHSGIPSILKSLLEDPACIKVGVGIANDATKVLKDYNVCIKALEDLSDLANLKLGGIPKKWSLHSLTKRLTCKQLEKPNCIRLGNWEADVLSMNQLQYAATDAFSSWHLYQVLKSFPDVANDEIVDDTDFKS